MEQTPKFGVLVPAVEASDAEQLSVVAQLIFEDTEYTVGSIIEIPNPAECQMEAVPNSPLHVLQQEIMPPEQNIRGPGLAQAWRQT